jgi:hypothetical protein
VQRDGDICAHALQDAEGAAATTEKVLAGGLSEVRADAALQDRFVVLDPQAEADERAARNGAFADQGLLRI